MQFYVFVVVVVVSGGGGDGRGDKLIKQASNITTQLIPTSEAGDNALVHANWTFSL